MKDINVYVDLIKKYKTIIWRHVVALTLFILNLGLGMISYVIFYVDNYHIDDHCVGMANEKDKNRTGGKTFGVPTHPNLKGYYKPLSEFDEKVLNLVKKTFDYFVEATEADVNKVNRVNLRPSYSKMAKLLNEQGYKTKRGKKWTPTGVRRLLEKVPGRENLNVGHTNNNWEASKLKRKKTSDDFARKMRDKVLPSIDLSQKNHVIADELNERGVKTRTGGKWGNVAVKRLLLRIKKLED